MTLSTQLFAMAVTGFCQSRDSRHVRHRVMAMSFEVTAMTLIVMAAKMSVMAMPMSGVARTWALT